MTWYVALTLDLAGTFVFALTGALVAVRKRLDLFGTLVLAVATGLGGGLIRDVLIGDVPPPGLTDWRYLLAAALAGVATFLWHPVVARWENIILTLDAAGPRAVLRQRRGQGVRRRARRRPRRPARHDHRGRRRDGPRRPGQPGAGGAGGRHRLVRRPGPRRRDPRRHRPPLRLADRRWCSLPGMVVCFGWRVLSMRYGWAPMPAASSHASPRSPGVTAVQ